MSSLLVAARKRLTLARRRKTRADHIEACASGHGPERMAVAARIVAEAARELAEAEAQHAAIAEQFRLAELPKGARETAIELKHELERAERASGG